jgi:hypothetical protein
VERLNGSHKDEHLYRAEIPDALALAEEVAAFQRLYNEIRPHETLDFDTPLSRYLAPPESNLSGGVDRWRRRESGSQSGLPRQGIRSRGAKKRDLGANARSMTAV